MTVKSVKKSRNLNIFLLMFAIIFFVFAAFLLCYEVPKNSKVIILVLLLFTASFGIMLLMNFLNMKYSNKLTRKIIEINNAATLIAEGNFKIKIESSESDELDKLTETINVLDKKLSLSEKMKNDFISSISHELRTPLTAIKGWAETMQLSDIEDKVTIKKGLDIIVSETQRLSLIVEELLDFSSLQSGRIMLKKNKIDILAELDETIYMFKERAIAENKSLIYNETKMLSPVFGDKNKLKQVFINVIDNALKYTSDGGGASINVSEKDGKICISITDNGCGIAPKDLPLITEKFYKANFSQRGSGIGLSLVQEIIELHNGKLEILSEENFGTTVNIELPIYKEYTN